MANIQPQLVVLIVLDSARADHMSCYGYAKDTTPNLTALIKTQGIVFEQAFSAASWTLPSAASILTGVLPSIHGRFRRRQVPSSTPFTSIASRLTSAEIYTETISSNFFISKKYGFDEGFAKLTRILNFMDYSKLRRILRVIRTHYGKNMHQGGPEVFHLLREHIQSQEPRRAFYYLHLNDTHATYNVPRTAIEMANQREIGWRELLRLENPDLIKQSLIRRYDGAIYFIDQLLAGLINFLRERNLFDDTLLIITADHGEVFGEYKGYWGHGTHLSPTLLHVPLILINPKLFPEPRRVSQVVRTIDITPTILELFGIAWTPQYNPHQQGTSLIETITQNSSAPRLAISEEWVASTSTTEAGRWMRSGTDGHYQVIWDPQHHPEVYDLSSKSGTLSDLGDGCLPSKTQFLMNILENLAGKEQPLEFTDIEYDAEILQHLRALGYED